MSHPPVELLFVAAVSDLDTLRRRLLASPCLQPGRRPIVLRWNAASAAEALNPVLDGRPDARWVVWVHQDVFLPEGWDERFLSEAIRAQRASANEAPDRRDAPGAIGVLGVYGVAGEGASARRAGHVRDRGNWLREAAPLPCRVDSLDELLFAVPGDSPLRLDPALGYDLYATDLVLQAQQRGLQGMVVDAPCEHWSDTPVSGPMPASLIARLARSGDAFEAKWVHRLPVTTPLLDIRAPGDLRRFAESFATAPDDPTPPPRGVACLVCPKPDDDASEEFLFAWDRLRRGLGRGAVLVAQPAEAADPRSAVAGLPDGARVAWMPHAQVVVPEPTIARLVEALDAHPDLSAVLAHDQHVPSQPGPDYCTEGGLARYLDRLGAQPVALRPYREQRVPRLALTTAGAIRRQEVWSRAAWVSSAHVHDFADYQQSAREDMRPLVPERARRVLDVGGGEGGFLRGLREHRLATDSGSDIETHLAELSPQACARARAHVDRVWQGDFITLPIAERFDCVTFLDTLEHTAEPLRWLRRAHALLAPGGAVVASIPNVGHWSVVADLIEGRWDVSPVGIHCVTHLRFYTENGVRELFETAGLRITRIEPSVLACPAPWRDAWAAAAAAQGLRADPGSWDTYAFKIQAVEA
jgi:2-polyprenyl-3-methyl-5-hydroxy-6-metoxy-1,4-benzoquinol methylase